MVAVSTDGGLTLSPARPDPALIEPPAQASLLSVPPATDRPGLLLFSNPAASTRTKMTVRVSRDDGMTWTAGRVVHDGPAAYSSLVVLPDDTVGLLYERGARSPYGRITFARMTLGWLSTDR
jgi:sialidase-1